MAERRETVQISDLVPEGKVLTLHPSLAGPSREPSFFAVHPATWDRMEPNVQDTLKLGPVLVEMLGLCRAGSSSAASGRTDGD